MIWALLALLGVPLWLIAGMLLAILLSRRRFRKRPDAFPLKVRLLSGEFPGMSSSFPRAVAYALWVQNVLAIFHGTARVRVVLLPTLALDQATTTLPEVKGLGAEPYDLTVRLDNGALVQLAVPYDARGLAAGPYEKPMPTPGV